MSLNDTSVGVVRNIHLIMCRLFIPSPPHLTLRKNFWESMTVGLGLGLPHVTLWKCSQPWSCHHYASTFAKIILLAMSWRRNATSIKMRDDVGHLFIYYSKHPAVMRQIMSTVGNFLPIRFGISQVVPGKCPSSWHHSKNPPKCKKKHHEAKKTKIIGKFSVEFCLATILRCCAKKITFPNTLFGHDSWATCSGILVDNKVVTS